MVVRVPLQIIEDRLILSAVIECSSLRVRYHFIEFVIDTGSQNSFLSEKDVMKMQISVESRETQNEVDFGGSRFKQVYLPKFTMHLLKEGGSNECVTIGANLTALKTTKTAERKKQIAQTLPSILGMDFLREQKISLHVIPAENLSYLQIDQ